MPGRSLRLTTRGRIVVGSLLLVLAVLVSTIALQLRGPSAASQPSKPADAVQALVPDVEGDSISDYADDGAYPSPTAEPQLVAAGRFIRVALPESHTGGHRVVTYTLEIERGLQVDATQAAKIVSSVLEDARGWQGKDDVDFVPVPIGSKRAVNVKVTIATPDTTDALCLPLRTHGTVSCWNGSRAVLNSLRWTTGAKTYGDDLANYRTYLVNHEVGHGIGHHHEHCARKGAKAPVMLQQTKTLEQCVANPWP